MKKNRKMYTKQRNYCGSLIRKTKKTYYENLDERTFFWKTVKPLISEKFNARERISLSKNAEIAKTEKGTPKVFSNYFGNIVKNLNIS